MKKDDEFKPDELVRIAFDGGAELLGAVLEGTLAAAIPPAYTIINTARMQRAHKNLELVVKLLLERQETIEALLKDNPAKYDFVRNKLFPFVLDRTIDEIQEEKINFLANGIETALDRNQANMDMILTHYDILERLRFADINYLICLSNRGQMADEDINKEEYGAIDIYTYRKLESLGLITRADYLSFGGFPKKDEIKNTEINLTTWGETFLAFFRIIGK